MTRRDSPDSVLPNDSIEAPNHPGVSRCLWKEWCHMGDCPEWSSSGIWRDHMTSPHFPQDFDIRGQTTYLSLTLHRTHPFAPNFQPPIRIPTLYFTSKPIHNDQDRSSDFQSRLQARPHSFGRVYCHRSP